jgi:hypothetical protein
VILVAFTAILALAAEAVPPSVTAPPPTPMQREAQKLKCEKIVVLGSRMPVRVCRTPEQIAAQAKATEDTMRNIKGELQDSPAADIKR